MPESQSDAKTEDADNGAAGFRAGVEDDWLAANVRESRARLGLSQGEVARRMADLGWPWYQQTVRRIEEGSRRAGAGEAKALARIFGTTVDRLMMPGREASAGALLETRTARAYGAWEQISGATASLAAAQRQLSLTAGVAVADFPESPLIGRLLGEARRALALTAEGAVKHGKAAGEDGGEGEAER